VTLKASLPTSRTVSVKNSLVEFITEDLCLALYESGLPRGTGLFGSGIKMRVINIKILLLSEKAGDAIPTSPQIIALQHSETSTGWHPMAICLLNQYPMSPSLCFTSFPTMILLHRWSSILLSKSN
jgi:hypothetical protein